jgi:hypothetical protein
MAEASAHPKGLQTEARGFWRHGNRCENARSILCHRSGLTALRSQVPRGRASALAQTRPPAPLRWRAAPFSASASLAAAGAWKVSNPCTLSPVPRLLHRCTQNTNSISRATRRCHNSTSALTLPSSGPAYGRPLKPNVRPRFKPHHESTSAIRCAARAFAQNTGCRRRFEVSAPAIRCAARAVARDTGCHRCFWFGAPARGHSLGRLGLSVLRRPARGRVISNASNYGAPAPLAHSCGTHLQAPFKRRSASLRFQRWYASPCKFKARLRLHERGLTLPSSGRAFGTPLKSNVRPHGICHSRG